jgi:hypothetical protein
MHRLAALAPPGWDKIREQRHKRQLELGLFLEGTPKTTRSAARMRVGAANSARAAQARAGTRRSAVIG